MLTQQAHCNDCGPNRNHLVLAQERTVWNDDEARISGSDLYEFLKCAGCGSVKVKHTSYFSEADPEKPDITYFPPATSRRQPPWLNDFFFIVNEEGQFLRALILEIYSAIYNGANSLAAMGVRALLEHVMIEKTGDRKSFASNLQAFQEGGYISSNQKSRLETILEVGHASIHRGFRPSNEDVATLVDIAVSVVADVFVHVHQVTKLHTRIPPRPK